MSVSAENASSLEKVDKKSNKIDLLNETAKENSKSKELSELLEHQKQIKEWLETVNTRIFEFEDKYLTETINGNIIKGWESDGKFLPVRGGGNRGFVEDKDRLFTYSSCEAWANFPNLLNKTQKAEEKATKTGNFKRNSSNFDIVGNIGAVEKKYKSTDVDKEDYSDFETEVDVDDDDDYEI